MVCQCDVINFGMHHCGGGFPQWGSLCMCGGRGRWQHSGLSTQFCYEPETALKTSSILKSMLIKPIFSPPFWGDGGGFIISWEVSEVPN